jgi:hypothetical protein
MPTEALVPNDETASQRIHSTVKLAAGLLPEKSTFHLATQAGRSALIRFQEDPASTTLVVHHDYAARGSGSANVHVTVQYGAIVAHFDAAEALSLSERSITPAHASVLTRNAEMIALT